VQALADIIGQGDRFGIAENLNRFARSVYDNSTVGALGEMLFQVDSYAGVKNPVEIVG
jgi:hypothetical protein